MLINGAGRRPALAFGSLRPATGAKASAPPVNPELPGQALRRRFSAGQAGDVEASDPDLRLPHVIVLHAVWSRDGRRCVWAEDSERPANAPRRRGRRPVKPRPRAHPFAADVEQIKAALTTAGVPDRKNRGAEDTVVLRLPSSADGPGPSPHIRRGAEAVGAAPWVVPVLAFSVATALDVLLASPLRSGPVAPDASWLR